jgi:hypothetical protein
MEPGAPGLRFPVRVDRTWLKADLDNATPAGREALASALAAFRKSGVPVERLRACDANGRDGTNLGGCVKVYLPPPLGPWGAVFTGAISETGKVPTLLLLAAGERHPSKPWRPSVYEVAHRRLHGAESA